MNDAKPLLSPASAAPANPSIAPRLFLLPGIVILVAIWLARAWTYTGEMAPFKFFFGLVIAPGVGMLLLLLWWLFASGIRWTDRFLGVFVFVLAATATFFIADKNITGMPLILYALPVVSTLWVVWLMVSYKLEWSIRRLGVLLVFVGTAVHFSLIRVDGMDGSFAAKFNWRWTPTSEASFLSELKSTQKSTTVDEAVIVPDLVLSEGDWSGFRGPQRDSRLTDLQLPDDWYKTPPKELWRHKIGPGWSSFAVIGNRLFTQEQRGNDEFVVCYDADTGNEVWSHHDEARFEEVVAGPGPRATPTFQDGMIFALGAKGRLNCLNAATGKLNWSADIVADSKASVPQWGFSASPFVSHGLVTVYAGGPDGKGVVAYRVESGEFAWAAGGGSHSYCSTQVSTLDGVEQLLVASDAGMTSIQPQTGEVLWEHPWKVESARVVQPAVISDTDVLLGTGMSGGTRRLSVKQVEYKWEVNEVSTTKSIKPYFNDFVVLDDHLYGFDGPVFMCVSLDGGKIKWRARGYGNGQVLLLHDKRQLLILSETGEVVAVEASPAKHNELGKFKAIEGKTWNHPVVAHGKLFVRNAEEVACFQLPVGSSQPATNSELN